MPRLIEFKYYEKEINWNIDFIVWLIRNTWLGIISINIQIFVYGKDI